MTRDLVSSRKQDWSTPDHLVQQWVEEYNLNTDLCAMPYNARLPNFITPEMDSLSKPWADPIRGFCNPPYGDIPSWMRHALLSCSHGGFSLHLVPANPDTAWFHDYAKHAQVDFFRGRVNFVDLTPPEIEIERLMLCPPTKANVSKIAYRLNWLASNGDFLSNFDNAVKRCFEVLGSDCFSSGKYTEEKQSGAGFPTMLVIFDPTAAAGPKPFRTRCSKTGKLL